MFNKELTHQIFDDLDEYSPEVSEYNRPFVTDLTLQIHTESSMDVSTKNILTNDDHVSAINTGYVLWVDDVFDPYTGAKSKHLDKNTSTVIVVRNIRNAIEVFDKLGPPKTVYLDYNLDGRRPETGVQLLYWLSNYVKPDSESVNIIPISSDSEMNMRIADAIDENFSDILYLR